MTALLGPWSHNYPHISPSGPQVGFLQMLLAWVRDNVPQDANGALEVSSKATLPAPYTVFASIVKGVPDPQPEPMEAGEWLAFESAEDAAAVAPVAVLPLLPHAHLGAAGAPSEAGEAYVTGSCREAAAALAAGNDSLEALPAGMEGGAWFTFGNSPDLPRDQTPDDRRAVAFSGAAPPGGHAAARGPCLPPQARREAHKGHSGRAALRHQLRRGLHPPLLWATQSEHLRQSSPFQGASPSAL